MENKILKRTIATQRTFHYMDWSRVKHKRLETYSGVDGRIIKHYPNGFRFLNRIQRHNSGETLKHFFAKASLSIALIDSGHWILGEYPMGGHFNECFVPDIIDVCCNRIFELETNLKRVKKRKERLTECYYPIHSLHFIDLKDVCDNPYEMYSEFLKIIEEKDKGQDTTK